MKGIKQKMVLSAAVLGAVIFFYLLRFVLASPGVPQIDFVSPTDASGSNVPRNYTYINISVVNDTQVTAVGVEWDGVNVTLFNRSGLIGLWHFSENSIASGGVKDSSGNDYHATASGATFTNNGKFDSAWSFDGVDDIVDTGSSTIFNNLKSLTIEMWINRSGGGALITDHYGCVSWESIFLYDTLFIVNSANGGDGANRQKLFWPAPSNNVWTHIAAVWNGTRMLVYLNGTLINTTSATSAPWNNAQTATMGAARITNDCWGAGTGTISGEFNGTMDEVRIWNRALSADEINRTYRSELGKYLNKDVYFLNITNNNNATINYYAWVRETGGSQNKTGTRSITFGFLNDTVPPTWSNNQTNSTSSGKWINHSVVLSDDTGLSYYIFEFDNGTGTLQNISTVSVSGSQVAANQTVRVNVSTPVLIRWRYYFNDTQNWNKTNLFSYTATIERKLISKDNAYELLYNDSHATARINNNDVITTLSSGWHYVGLVYDKDSGANNLGLYIDGALATSGTLTGAVTSNTNNITIGEDFVNARIDEVMIFNRSLTANEVAFLYESTTKKVTTAGEIPKIDEDANVTIVLASPGSSYFDNIKVKAGKPLIRFVVPYSKIDIQNSVRYGPGDHNIVISYNGFNSTTNKPIVRIE